MNKLKQAMRHIVLHFVPHSENNYKPHALSHKNLSLYAGFLISMKILTIFSLSALPENQAHSSAVNIPNIIELTNLSRAGFSESPLNENKNLDIAAQHKAEDIIAKQYFAHISPDGVSGWDFIKASNYNYLIAGENLAINFYSAEGVAQAWMNSPEHKANILNKDFEDIGVGIAQGTYKGVNAVIVVQMFGTSMDQPYSAATTLTPTPQMPAQAPALVLPPMGQSGLATPVLNDPGVVLTRDADLNISGTAPGAQAVYLAVNGKPIVAMPVANGIFSGTLSLSEGANAITAVSFDNHYQNSDMSKPVFVRLDTIAPAIKNVSITQAHGPEFADENSYNIQVQTQGDAVAVMATLGGRGVMLQPTDNPEVWTGTLSAPGALLQGDMFVRSTDLAGNVGTNEAAQFSGSTVDNYGFQAQDQKSVQVLGKNIGMGTINNIYMYFVAGILAALALAIGLKRRIQHMPMIVHASGIAVVALMLWIH